MGRVARRRHRRRRRRLSAPPAAVRGRHPARPRPARAGPERPRHPAEGDGHVKILSGVFEGQTLGTPISLQMPNLDMRPGDYREVMEKYRPSHADYTYDAKYGFRDWRGGGRTSARETAGRVAAGAIARKLLALRWNVTVVAWVSKVGTLRVDCDVEKVTREQVEATPIRCPDLAMAERMITAVEAARKDGDSLGGIVTCAVRGCPVGWGEPVFDRLEADLAKAMMSLPASKGFEIGS